MTMSNSVFTQGVRCFSWVFQFSVSSSVWQNSFSFCFNLYRCLHGLHNCKIMYLVQTWSCTAVSDRNSEVDETGCPVISSHLAGRVDSFWYSEPPNPPVNAIRTRHHWYSPTLAWVLLLRVIIQSGMARRKVQVSLSFHCGTAWISAWSPCLLSIHLLPWSDDPLVVFLTMLCWWYPALSVLPTRWPDCLNVISEWMMECHLQLLVIRASP